MLQPHTLNINNKTTAFCGEQEDYCDCTGYRHYLPF